MTPAAARAWFRIFRDFIIVAAGFFVIIHETIVTRAPSPLLVGAGLVLLGVPPALRADQWLKTKDDEEDKTK